MPCAMQHCRYGRFLADRFCRLSNTLLKRTNHMKSAKIWVFLLIAITACFIAATRTSAGPPPPVAREFRAAWIATVANIDWPSKPGLPTDVQQRELVALLDKACELNLNALILQIRPSADALYPSDLEPWSEFLTGRMGQPPQPFYDPLQFAIDEAHRRGLQLHVWFNPYRVRLPESRSEPADNHSSVTRRNIVRQYGGYLWFDPGEPQAVEHFLAVLNDVVKRYDIDGVHIDDYFYPYPVKDEKGQTVPFPDEESYQRAVQAGTTLSRDDWRRENVNRLIKRMYDEVKETKPWVLVGISPFGIWRPGHPPGITGLDQYSSLYADARLWLREGWLDYFTPQLYWSISSQGQSYPRLLAWWAEQNVKLRHLWPGNFTSRVRPKPESSSPGSNWTAEEILQQIEVTRTQAGATGNVHFSMKALAHDYDGLADKLKAGPYREPALVPESPWLGRAKPPRPEITAQRIANGIAINMKPPDEKPPWQWLVRVETNEGWQSAIVPGWQAQYLVPLSDHVTAKRVLVSAVSRLGRIGRAAGAEL